MLLISQVAAETVQERDYFLSALEEPYVINGIRIACVLALVFFVGSYLRNCRKRR